MCKYLTLNCTVGALETPVLFTQCKKIEWNIPASGFPTAVQSFYCKKTPVQKYTGPCSESHSHPGNKGLLEESDVLCELLHHKGTETHQLQEFISTICQAFVHFLKREQRRENPLKMAMLKAAMSWGTVENKFASSSLNQHRFLQQPHHIPLQLDWELWALQPPSHLLEAPTWKLHTQRGVALALQAPAICITAGHPHHLPGCSHFSKTSTTAGLPSSSEMGQVNVSSLFWKGVFYSPE